MGTGLEEAEVHTSSTVEVDLKGILGVVQRVGERLSGHGKGQAGPVHGPNICSRHRTTQHGAACMSGMAASMAAGTSTAPDQSSNMTKPTIPWQIHWRAAILALALNGAHQFMIACNISSCKEPCAWAYLHAATMQHPHPTVPLIEHVPTRLVSELCAGCYFWREMTSAIVAIRVHCQLTSLPPPSTQPQVRLHLAGWFPS